jgi:large subunit ribosomal protein L19
MQKHLESAKADRKIDEFRPGDLICVHVLVQEGGKERVQKFEGRCIARHGGGTDETYTVWSVIADVGVRRVFPLYAYDVTLIRRGKVRRAKLNYLTKLRGKSARIKERGRKS